MRKVSALEVVSGVHGSEGSETFPIFRAAGAGYTHSLWTWDPDYPGVICPYIGPVWSDATESDLQDRFCGERLLRPSGLRPGSEATDV